MITCNLPSPAEPLNLYYLRGMRGRVFSELALMAQQLGMTMRDEPFGVIFQAVTEHLFEIENLCCDGDIDPRALVCACGGDGPGLPYPRRLRVGFYPIAANPLHWGHLLIGLRATASLQLDKIVYVVSGRDARKPHMHCADQRFIMARDTMKFFAPLFCCSDLARYSGCDGETNLFRFLKLNRHQPMDVFYIAGGDHCRRFYPGTEYPDTLAKLELHIQSRAYSHDPEQHGVRIAFIERGEGNAQAETTIPAHMIRALPFAASSTMIRDALAGVGPRGDLALLPYESYVDICAMNLYGRELNVPAIPMPEADYVKASLKAVA